MSLSDIVARFKTLTTKKYIDGVGSGRYPAFEKRLWQRNYYEHIIRNEQDLNDVRQYITDNPPRWNEDENNLFRVEISL